MVKQVKRIGKKSLKYCGIFETDIDKIQLIYPLSSPKLKINKNLKTNHYTLFERSKII